MKRIILLLLSLLLVLLFSGCRGDSGAKLPEKNPVFRNVNWGMTPEEVRAVETATLVDLSEGGVEAIAPPSRFGGLLEATVAVDDTKLFFKLKLFDEYPCILIYLFDRGKRLIEATYALKDFAGGDETIREIRALLIEKYGRPDREANSGLVYWVTDRSMIILRYFPDLKSGGQASHSLFIRYTEKESPAQRKEREKNIVLDALKKEEL